jgi:LuxR family maltose regulon positive regulatory protein
MFVSLNTVKSHVKSIYRKLDATSRKEAVQRGRQFAVAVARSPRALRSYP